MKKILILEDEEILLNLYSKKLEGAGYIVEKAINVLDARKLIENNKFDLALIDHGLRGQEESGLSFVPQLKHKNPNVKAVILTNFSGNDFEKEARKAGADDLIIKLNMPPSQLPDYLKRLL